MKGKLEKILGNKFLRNVAIVASGAAGAQFINMGFAPIITRLYGPEAFGILGTFMSMLNILIPVSALTYPIAIILPKSDQDAHGLVRLSFIVAVVISCFAFLLLLPLGSYIAGVLDVEAIGRYLYLIPIGMFSFALLQIAQQWLIRKKEFLLNARISIIQSIAVNVAKVGIGFVYPAAAVLIVIYVFGAALNFLMLLAGIRKRKIGFISKRASNHKPIRELGKDYNDFPLYRAPQMLINEISQNFPVLILTMLFGPAYAGFYTLGKTVMIMPVSLIGKSVGDVFYPRINEAAHQKEMLSKLLLKASLALFMVGIVPFSIVLFFGPKIFSLIFGSDWWVAGQYAQWLALWMFSMLVVNPSVKALPILKAQKFHLVYTCCLTAIRIFAMFVGYYIYSSDIYAVALYSLSAVLGNIVLISIIYKKSLDYDRHNSSIALDATAMPDHQ
ncbi:lipopolysaccharide biosynthesis protein [Halomonas shantousis]